MTTRRIEVGRTRDDEAELANLLHRYAVPGAKTRATAPLYRDQAFRLLMETRAGAPGARALLEILARNAPIYALQKAAEAAARDGSALVKVIQAPAGRPTVEAIVAEVFEMAGFMDCEPRGE